VAEFDKLLIPVYFNNQQVDVTPKSIDAKLNIEKSVEEAFSVGRKGTEKNGHTPSLGQ
jgi:hypothetical protein